MGEVKEFLTYEVDEIKVIPKAGMLNVITPIFSKYSSDEEGRKKRGHLIAGFSLKGQEDELRSAEHALLFICVVFVIFSNLGGESRKR